MANRIVRVRVYFPDGEYPSLHILITSNEKYLLKHPRVKVYEADVVVEKLSKWLKAAIAKEMKRDTAKGKN